ncbi:hypothetical protein GGX14DRAFT_604434 [Mycena pura]|uniref:Uncharacterized protein n=1 Tax=Mycena pura TaxID=153505 RepID=A0AAD6YF44_9AGAR|nr:hypothetical protein GGX14DRAFT_604434 [Mycena pura]
MRAGSQNSKVWSPSPFTMYHADELPPYTPASEKEDTRGQVAWRSLSQLASSRLLSLVAGGGRGSKKGIPKQLPFSPSSRFPTVTGFPPPFLAAALSRSSPLQTRTTVEVGPSSSTPVVTPVVQSVRSAGVPPTGAVPATVNAHHDTTHVAHHRAPYFFKVQHQGSIVTAIQINGDINLTLLFNTGCDVWSWGDLGGGEVPGGLKKNSRVIGKVKNTMWHANYPSGCNFPIWYLLGWPDQLARLRGGKLLPYMAGEGGRGGLGEVEKKNYRPHIRILNPASPLDNSNEKP